MVEKHIVMKEGYGYDSRIEARVEKEAGREGLRKAHLMKAQTDLLASFYEL
jgi:hypothetical protein